MILQFFPLEQVTVNACQASWLKRSSRVLCCQVQFSHHHHITRKNTLRNCFSIFSEITLHFQGKLKQNSFEMNNQLKNQTLCYILDDWLTLAYPVLPWPTRKFWVQGSSTTEYVKWFPYTHFLAIIWLLIGIWLCDLLSQVTNWSLKALVSTMQRE